MTPEEHADLHEQAQTLAYTAILYADLHRQLSNSEWDGLAEEIGREVVGLIVRRVDKQWQAIGEVNK